MADPVTTPKQDKTPTKSPASRASRTSKNAESVRSMVDQEEVAKLPDPVDSLSDRLEDVAEPIAGHAEDHTIKTNADLGECPCGPDCQCSIPEFKPDPVDSLSDRLENEPEPIAGHHESEVKIVTNEDLGDCPCGPDCVCSLPEMKEEEEEGEVEEEKDFWPVKDPIPNYNLNDFVRAKEFFMTASTKTGISLYDHLSELIRKLLDNRAPEHPVDFLEEISLNAKRYRFNMAKDVIQDSYYLSEELVKDSAHRLKNWKRHAMWSKEMQEREGEDATYGGFPNLLRLQYYLEQINVGLPREEMFKIALQLRQIKMQNPVTRVRFWGKIYGTQGNYYIFEAELQEGQILDNVWTSPEDKPENQEFEEMDFDEEEASLAVPGAADTFNRAGAAVMDPDIISAYEQSAGMQPPTTFGLVEKLPPSQPPPPPPITGCEHLGEQKEVEAELAENAKWREYMAELTTDFPQAIIEPTYEVPSEEQGHGVNRRIFFVWPERLGRAVALKPLHENMQGWTRSIKDVPSSQAKVMSDDEQAVLPLNNTTTPAQINSSRQIRWFLTGDLNTEVRSWPPFPGREGDYLRAMLARITAGTAISPKGYYKTKRTFDDEDEGEEEEEEEDVEEEEEEEASKEDIVYPVKKFRPENIRDLVNPHVELWVHHAAYILRQGRTVWFDMEKLKDKKKSIEEEMGEEEEDEDVEEEEEEGKRKNIEFGPKLFSSLEQDTFWDNTKPWSARASSSVFQEFEVANVRSNLWPGANAMCTVKGKVENLYLGDALKFQGRSYAPILPEEPQFEYKDGPELMEIEDPSVQAEQEWLAKLQLDEIADVEAKFVDNEEEEEGEGDDEEDEDEDEDD